MLGPMINPTDLEEGDDVYFECNVKANPPAYKLTWWHNVSTLISISIPIIIRINVTQRLIFLLNRKIVTYLFTIDNREKKYSTISVKELS